MFLKCENGCVVWDDDEFPVVFWMVATTSYPQVDVVEVLWHCWKWFSLVSVPGSCIFLLAWILQSVGQDARKKSVCTIHILFLKREMIILFAVLVLYMSTNNDEYHISIN